ncbi:Dynein assembly factor with WDR repeat domains 1 [Terramyces sp. JEL0728]|nr:Dynein assembly factor with WDR repeat domains 1 [Terramyces sp. JEL0728]
MLNQQIKLKRLLLRYYPPGLTIEYESDHHFNSKHIDLLDLNEKTNLTEIANQICLDNHIPTTKLPKILEFLKKLQQKIAPNYSKYSLFKTLNTHVMPLTNCVFDKSGGRFLTGSYDRTAKLWDTGSGKEILSLNGHQNVVYALAFNNPFSDKIATGSFDKTVKLWEAETGKCVYTYSGHTGEVVSVNFNPQSSIILSASMDSNAILWDVRAGHEIRKLFGHTGEVISGVFSNDGGLVATGSFDSTVNIWDMRNHSILHTLIGHRAEISNVSFNFTGNRLVSGSIDGSAKVWDTIAGSGHTDQVLDVAFSLNEKMIATASADGTAYIVDANTFEVLHELKGHTNEISKVKQT